MSTTETNRCSSLGELADRLRSSDLVPSQQPLLDDLQRRFDALAAAGVTSVTDLRRRLPDRRAATRLAAETGIDEEYVMLLGRAVRGFFPRPTRLTEFDWIAPATILGLRDVGITNSEQLRTAVAADADGLADRARVPAADLTELALLSDLVRIQWISASFARALIVAGFETPGALAAADAAELVQRVAAANRDRRFFNASIGERDMRRVVDAAGYVERAHRPRSTRR